MKSGSAGTGRVNSVFGSSGDSDLAPDLGTRCTGIPGRVVSFFLSVDSDSGFRSSIEENNNPGKIQLIVDLLQY